jgi:hypothetical protein
MRWALVWGTYLAAVMMTSCTEDDGAWEGCFPADAPLCGQACMNSCGCMCSSLAAPRCMGDQVASCRGNDFNACYSGQQCAPGGCVQPHAQGEVAHCLKTCEEVRQVYKAVLIDARVGVAEPGSDGLAPGPYNQDFTSCTPEDCMTTTPANCELGLGPCWYLGKPIPKLEQLAEIYQSLGCVGSVSCDCPAPVVAATCESSPNVGGWAAPRTTQRFAFACVVK